MTASGRSSEPRRDQERSCQECGDAFWFSREEQAWYAAKGYVHPKHCPQCRWARQRSGPVGREAFPEALPGTQDQEVTCAACGALTRVPFVPTGNRPIYCDACFRNR